jgi:hypothetical protein
MEEVEAMDMLMFVSAYNFYMIPLISSSDLVKRKI